MGRDVEAAAWRWQFIRCQLQLGPYCGSDSGPPRQAQRCSGVPLRYKHQPQLTFNCPNLSKCPHSQHHYNSYSRSSAHCAPSFFPMPSSPPEYPVLTLTLILSTIFSSSAFLLQLSALAPAHSLLHLSSSIFTTPSLPSASFNLPSRAVAQERQEALWRRTVWKGWARGVQS